MGDGRCLFGHQPVLQPVVRLPADFFHEVFDHVERQGRLAHGVEARPQSGSRFR